jgi:hypothetical protein
METKRNDATCVVRRRARDFLSSEGRLVPYLNFTVS